MRVERASAPATLTAPYRRAAVRRAPSKAARPAIGRSVHGATVAFLIGLCALIAGCGGAHKATAAASASAQPSLAAPSLLEPPRAAPDIALMDSTGQRVTLSQFHGKAVLLTFIYDHCPDVCPLIVANLHNALDLLGPKASRVQVVAVSVDPRGDTPATVRPFLAAHAMTGTMRYLIGSTRELAPVWREWGVAVQASPDRREVGHSAFVYGISGSGKVVALYPANLKPQWLVHDVPLLASS